MKYDKLLKRKKELNSFIIHDMSYANEDTTLNCKHNKKIYAPFKPWYISKVVEKCKHNQIKTKCTKCFEEKFGKVCDKCKLRKEIFAAAGGSEGGKDSICKCDKI